MLCRRPWEILERGCACWSVCVCGTNTFSKREIKDPLFPASILIISLLFFFPSFPTLSASTTTSDAMEAKYIQWRSSYLRSSHLGLYCYYNASLNNGNAITCSEAHGYAMLISVLHRNKPDFDGLLAFFLHFRNQHGLMCWQVCSPHQPSSSDPVQPYTEEDGRTSATDGDVDIASSLYMAAKVFREEEGRYRGIADELASAVMRWEIHPELGTPLLGDWCNRDTEEGKKLYDATRSSDFILSAFAMFSIHHRNPAERERWGWVLESTKKVALSSGGTTGFLPDFLVFDRRSGTWHPPHGKLLESEHDGALNWNACRTPWRLAHYLATTGDTTILPLLQHAHGSVRRMEAFNFPSIPAGFKLTEGEPKKLVDYSDKAFIAPVGYLCHVLGDTEGQQKCVRALEEEEKSYFGDTIDVLIAEQASHSHEWL